MPEISFEARAVRLFDLIAEEQRPCKRCGAAIWMVRHSNGKLAPYTADLTNHFINCPNAAEFRRK
jgi:uncharacterized protein with PIN domain